MNLYEQHPYWLMKNGLIRSYPSLKQDISVDVAIMGAGISGALAAYYLLDTGMTLAVLDKRHAGCGSTAASTSFLLYELDTPLVELCQRVGKEDAVQSYKLCRQAIYELEQVCRKIQRDGAICQKPSLQYASYKKHRPQLYEEYELRRSNGFDVAWLDAAELEKRFGICAPGALLSSDGAEADAYALTHAFLDRVSSAGHGVYDNTDITEIAHTQRRVHLHTSKGQRVSARKLVIATGYESQRYLPHRVADIHTTYAIVSEPIETRKWWHKDSMVWETADPYLYFRKVDGDKILVGGRDDRSHHPQVQPSVIKRKAAMLEQAFRKRMPHIPLTADHSWCGAFAVTKDGLPYIGAVPGMAHTYFALGYGGNGITFSIIAAEMIRDAIQGKKSEHAHLFRFDR